MTDVPGFFTRFAKQLHSACLLVRIYSKNQADTHIEGLEGLLTLDVSAFDQQLEEPGDLSGGAVDDGVGVLQHAVYVAGKAATGDVGHASHQAFVKQGPCALEVTLVGRK